jgi:hypothetical protein
MILSRLLIVFVCLIFHKNLQAQSAWDTTYYKSTKNKLNLGFVISQRSYQINLNAINNDSAARDFSYQANAPGAIGFMADYDKLSLAVLFKLKATDDPKNGFTRFNNLALSVGGNNLLFEGGYRFFKGFYDETSAGYLPGYNDTTPYFRQASMTANYLKVKGYYFTNRERFSYKSSYSCGYRQLKSASTWVLTANFLSERLIADSALIPIYLRPEYDHGDNIRGIAHLGFGAGAGFSGTLVFWKRFFGNLSFIPSLHVQRRLYKTINDRDTEGYYLTILNDSRISVGYSGEKFFMLLSGTNDTHWLSGKGLRLRPSFISATFAVGFRVSVENTRAVKKVKELEFYNRL